MKLSLKEAYHPIDLSLVKCSGCGSIGKWESNLIHSQEFGINSYELRCLQCNQFQYEDEWNHNSISCPQCGLEMIITPYPSNGVDEEFVACCYYCGDGNGGYI